MPDTTVAAIIMINDADVEKILLTKRKIEPFKDDWCLPGGHIDPNETAKEAIIREVKEETGINFEPKFFKYFDEIIPKKEIHAVVLVFHGSHSGSLIPSKDEVSQIGWFSLSDCISLSLAFKHKEIIESYIRSRSKSRFAYSAFPVLRAVPILI